MAVWQLVRFFHPRRDRWGEHFHFNQAEIEPLTESSNWFWVQEE